MGRDEDVLCEIDAVDCEFVGAVFQDDVVVLCKIVVYSAQGIS
jgi:hypothetical protein